MGQPRSFALGAPITHLEMENQGDQNFASTSPSSLKRSPPPPILVLDKPPAQYFNLLQRHAMALHLALQSPMTIYEISALPSPKSEHLPLTIARAVPSHLQWLNLHVDEKSTRVQAPVDFTETLRNSPIFEQLRSSFDSRTTITEVILRTFQSLSSINSDMDPQESPTAYGR